MVPTEHHEFLRTLPMKTFFCFLCAIAFTAATAFAEPRQIAPNEAAKLVASGKAVLVDVRELAEWKETGVAAPAVLLAKSDFDGARKEWKPFLETVGDRQIILYCRLGSRAGTVGTELEKQGFKVANAGGFTEWRKAGLPVREHQ